MSGRRLPIDQALIAEIYRLDHGGEVVELPRGRHGLSREEVETAQRARIILATAQLTTEISYGNTTTRAIIDRAGVSSKTFYSHYAGKEEAFLAAYTLFDGVLLKLSQSPAAVTEPRTATRRVIQTSLEALASWPLFTRMRMVQGRAAGPAVEERRLEMVDNITAVTMDAIEAARAVDPRVGNPSETTVLALMLGLADLMTLHVIRHEPETLPSLADALVDAIESVTYGSPPPYVAGE